MPQDGPPLLARYAESMFWIARYLERVENIARLVDVTQTFESPGRESESWYAMIRINADEDGFAKSGLRPDADDVKRYYLLDRNNPNSVPAAMEAARTNARTLRPVISTEMWMQLNIMHRELLSIQRSGFGRRPAFPPVRAHQDGRAGAYRDHRRHAVPRPGLFLLHAGPAAGAGRPDDAAASTSVTTCWCRSAMSSAAWRS